MKKLNSMVAALAVCSLLGSAAVHAQATAGDVFGKAPVGDAVLAKNANNGTQRQVKVDDKGRYSIRALPAGVYDVSLIKDGQVVLKHPSVPVIVGRGVKVDLEAK